MRFEDHSVEVEPMSRSGVRGGTLVKETAMSISPSGQTCSNKCIASSNKCLTSSNKKLLETSASLLVIRLRRGAPCLAMSRSSSRAALECLLLGLQDALLPNSETTDNKKSV